METKFGSSKQVYRDFWISVVLALTGILLIEYPRYLGTQPMLKMATEMINLDQMWHYTSPYTHWGLGLAGSLLLVISAIFLIRKSLVKEVSMQKTGFRILIAAVVLTGILFRVIQYTDLPHGLWIDNGFCGLHCLTVLKHHEFPIYFHSNYGYETLNPYLMTFFIALFENKVLVTRLPGLIVSLLTILAFMLFARRHFDRFITIAASTFLALSLSHIVMSRQGFRSIWMPLFSVMIMYWLLQALKDCNTRHFILAGIWMGLAQYSYVAMRLFIFIPALLILHQLLFKRIPMKKATAGFLQVYLAAGIVVLPLFLYFLGNVNLFYGRASSTVIFNMPEPWHEFQHNTRQILSLFSLAGDLQPRHNVLALPFFNPLEIVFFMIGLVVLIRRFRELKYASVLIWMLVMMAPAWITMGAPSFMRLLSMFPAAWLTAAIGFREIAGRIRRQTGYFFLAGVLLCGVVYSGYYFFSKWKESLRTMPSNKESLYGFCNDEVDLCKFFLNSPENEFVLSPQLFFHPSVQYLCYKKKGLILNSDPNWIEPYIEKNGSATFVYTSLDRNLWWLRTSPDKDFFFWQRREYDISDREIMNCLENHYQSHLPVIASDKRLEAHLNKQYPEAPRKKVGIFTLVTCRK